MAKVFIKCTRPLQTVQQIKSHAKYIGFRSKEVGEKGFFDKYNNNSDYKEFIKTIEDNPALKHSKSVKAHKLIFSLREKDYTAYKRSGKDYKDLIRSTLADYEKRNGVKLLWVANIHEKEGHPHCHVIIMGVSSERDSSGKYKRIFFKKEDYEQMKKDFDVEFDKDADYHFLEKIDFDKTLNDIGKGFEQVTRHIAKEAEKVQKEAERKKDKELDKKSRDNSKKDRGR